MSIASLCGPKGGRYPISICLASSPSSIRGEKNISLRSFCREGVFCFVLFWKGFSKYSDVWRVVEFIKVIFPDAVIFGQLTRQGCLISTTSPKLQVPPPASGTDPTPWELSQARGRHLTGRPSRLLVLYLWQPWDVGWVGSVLPILQRRNWIKLLS